MTAGFLVASIPNSEPVHESHKKAGSHCIGLGAARPVIQHKRWFSTTRLPGNPILEFIFSYAPHGWLQAKGIVQSLQRRPLTTQGPSDEASAGAVRKRPVSSSGSDIESLDPSEAREYQRLKEKMSKKRKVFKLEPLTIPPGTFRMGEIIDLTGD